MIFHCGSTKIGSLCACVSVSLPFGGGVWVGIKERGDLDGALALLQDGHTILKHASLQSEETALLLTRLGRLYRFSMV